MSEKKEIKIKILGAMVLFPVRRELKPMLKEATSPILAIAKEGEDRLLVYYANSPLGYLDQNNEDYSNIAQYLIREKELKGWLSMDSEGHFILTLSLEEQYLNAEEGTEEPLQNVLTNLVKRQLVTQDELDERIEYLKKWDIPEKQMLKLFSSYREYPDGIKAKIPNPKTKFIDSSERIVERSLVYANLGYNLWFEGDKGCGKNVMTETLAWLFYRPLYEFSVNSQHDNNSLLGGKTIESDEHGNIKMSYDPEVIVQAAEWGGILVLDEFNTALGHVMSLLNSLLDERRRISVPGYKEVVAHLNFLAIATINKNYQATFDTNEATADRFVHIVFPATETLDMILAAKVKGISSSTMTQLNNVYSKILTSVKTSKIDSKSLTIRGFIYAANAIVEGVPIKMALQDAVANGVGDLDDRKIISNAIEDVLG